MSASICVQLAAPCSQVVLGCTARTRHTHNNFSSSLGNPVWIDPAAVVFPFFFFKFREIENPLRRRRRILWRKHKLGLMIPYFLLLSRTLVSSSNQGYTVASFRFQVD